MALHYRLFNTTDPKDFGARRILQSLKLSAADNSASKNHKVRVQDKNKNNNNGVKMLRINCMSEFIRGSCLWLDNSGVRITVESLAYGSAVVLGYREEA